MKKIQLYILFYLKYYKNKYCKVKFKLNVGIGDWGLGSGD